MSAVVINGGLVHYEAFGKGDPILFLHGWLGSWRYWMQTMESLAIEYRVYAVDLWGFGDSDKSEKRFGMDEYVTLVERFITDQGLDEPIIVGHALGAAVALEYAARKVAPVSKIMAVSLPLSEDSVNHRLKNYLQPSILPNVLFRWKPIPTKEIEEEAERAAEKVIPMSLESWASYNFQEKLHQVECNILLVFGEKDDVVDPTPIKGLNNESSHVKYISLASSRHFPMVDESAKFNRLLKDFADKNATLESLSLKEEWRRRTR